MLIFATYENITKLAACRTWYMDETFKCVPKLYFVTILAWNLIDAFADFLELHFVLWVH